MTDQIQTCVALSASERLQLRQASRRALSELSPMSVVRELLTSDSGFDRSLQQKFIELGWSGIHLPEALGGFGSTLSDTAVVVSELGRALVGGPFVSSAVIAACTLAACNNTDLTQQLVPSLVDGSTSATIVVAGPHGHYTGAGLGAKWTPTPDGGGVLDGVSSFVLDANNVEHLIVFSRSADDVVASVIRRDHPGVTATALPLLDQTRRLFEVAFDRVGVAKSDVIGGGVELLEYAVEVGAVVMALDSFGLAQVVVEQTAEYAKHRMQFGRSIGSFQAIKHRMADGVLLVETSRVASDHAAELVSLEAVCTRAQRGISVSTAKAYVCDAAVKICGDSVQIHGGIGFTWEHDAHLFLKRAMLNQSLFGSSSWHRRRVADFVVPPVVSRQP